MSVSLSKLSELIGGELAGDGSVEISGIGEIESAGEGEITFIANSKYTKYLNKTAASAVLVPKDMDGVELPHIKVDDPHIAKARVIELFHPAEELGASIDEGARIDGAAKIGRDCYVGFGAYVGAGASIGKRTKVMHSAVISDGATIGESCIIGHNATIYGCCRIGDRVEIGAGTVIGSEGFGFLPSDKGIMKVRQVGAVYIEDDVRIGANCTIDRGTIGKTVVRYGAKLDNLIQLAHNVEVGAHTIIVAQTGISGSTKIGSGVLIGGQVGIIGHVEVGDGVRIGAQSGVTRSIKPGITVSGYPAREHSEALARDAQLGRVQKLADKIKLLEKEISELKRE